MQLERRADGSMTLGSLPPMVVDTLLRLPGWLRDEDPRVRDRLLPAVHEDPEEQAAWQRLAGSELEHLFLGRTEVVEGDLRSLEREPEEPPPPDGPGAGLDPFGGMPTFAVDIPAGHEHAWLASLNAARLALFTRHELGEADMERDPDDFEDPEKGLAILRIQMMAYVQELLITAMSGGQDLSGPPPTGDA